MLQRKASESTCKFSAGWRSSSLTLRAEQTGLLKLPALKSGNDEQISWSMEFHKCHCIPFGQKEKIREIALGSFKLLAVILKKLHCDSEGLICLIEAHLTLSVRKENRLVTVGTEACTGISLTNKIQSVGLRRVALNLSCLPQPKTCALTTKTTSLFH